MRDNALLRVHIVWASTVFGWVAEELTRAQRTLNRLLGFELDR